MASKLSGILQKVNLFLGTSGDHGQMYPGAEMPFGFVKLAPDTFPGAVTGSAHAGYDYRDRAVTGFSHVRFSGVGNAGVGGNISVLPLVAIPSELTPEACRQPFVKESEQCWPGYYSLAFESGITAEFTATHHVGIHRYVYPAQGDHGVLIDFCRGFTPVRDAHCLVVSPTEIAGELTCEQMNACGWYRLYFWIRFQHPAASVELFPAYPNDSAVRASVAGEGLVALARLNRRHTQPLGIKVGFSAISVAQARRNIEHEAYGWDFEQCRAAAEQAWETILQRVQASGQEEHERLLYSLLYRSCLSPFNMTDSLDYYMGDDGEVHRAGEGRTFYHGWSTWDTYRTKFPLLALITPERMPCMMTSLAETLDQRLGFLPGEELFDCHGYAPVPNVRMELSNVVLLDAHTKGVGAPDPESVFAVMRAIANLEFSGDRDRLGYVPRRPDTTCQYAYDNWAVLAMAEALGKSQERYPYYERSLYYRNVWDPSAGFFRARDEQGLWLELPPDPAAIDEKHVYEGSMWQWRWAVVHDIAGLVELLGGPSRFLKELSGFFEKNLHNHGNQPALHAPWLFAAAGAPWLSQRWVRRILTEPMHHRFGTHNALPQPYEGPAFRNTPDGFIPEMDDDDGCMAAWYVLSSIGLFPICPGRPLYLVGAPLFEEFSLETAAGKPFRIVARDWGPNAWYIQSAKLNGQPLLVPWLPHDQVASGGLLELTLGAKPNREWGAGVKSPW
ncbi:MAG: GH92 family glycosyl hydrolase [Candidatus Hydrogenedentes bacterium]|nr:GH92 family glycosyl hydrolase [Candidatus Hydrogenedentota bacterium]HOH33210.1 GH92 family glycosyl hydrolase [Candidatus Hydrogenedentota bacterium]